MSSKRRLRRKSCTGKERFVDQLAAQAAIGRLIRARGSGSGYLTPYRCSFCNGFHFGHAPARVHRLLA